MESLPKSTVKTKTFHLVAILALPLCLLFSCTAEHVKDEGRAVKMRPIEGFSSAQIQAFNKAQQMFSAPPAGMGSDRVQQVIAISKSWPSNHKITVAFQGGSLSLRQELMAAVQPWIDSANIQFDFGPDPASGHFREWSQSDTDYKADVRIGFTGRGYNSWVANESIDPNYSKPGEASMNLQDFTTALPSDWKAVALHEFGHVVGFEHEHRNPLGPCDQQFRWDDDPGYKPTADIYKQLIPDSQNRRPGIYTVLEGPLNRWSKTQIDFNLKELPNTRDYRFSTYDNTSIMKYYFDDWMLKDGVKSPCYSAENLALSDGDRAVALQTYPRSPSLMKLNATSQLKALNDLLNFKSLNANDEARYKSSVQSLRAK